MNPDFNSSNNPGQQVVYGGGQMSPAPSSKKRLAIVGVLAALIIIAGVVTVIVMNKSGADNGGGTAVAISNTVADVAISSSGYTPQTITVKQGQQVTFTNNDTTPRQLSADQTMLPGFATAEPLDQGDTYTYIFENKGTFHYYDATDPSKFVGTVTVQ